jgi:hypothetical protein
MSGKEGLEGTVQREAVEGQTTATGAQKETFGTGTAAQSEAGKKSGQIAKERGERGLGSPGSVVAP